MDLLEELKNKGANIDEGIERFAGNASLYEKMLFKLLDVLKKTAPDPEFDCNDYEDVIEQAHAIKGVTGNLSITPLYEAYTEIVALLRQHQPEQAKVLMKKILPVQEDIMNCIEKHS